MARDDLWPFPAVSPPAPFLWRQAVTLHRAEQDIPLFGAVMSFSQTWHVTLTFRRRAASSRPIRERCT